MSLVRWVPYNKVLNTSALMQRVWNSFPVEEWEILFSADGE